MIWLANYFIYMVALIGWSITAAGMPFNQKIGGTILVSIVVTFMVAVANKLGQNDE